MATPQLEQELTHCERQYWQAILEHDTNKALELTAFPCLLAGPQGAASVDEAAFRRMMASSPDNLQSAELRNVMVRQLSNDVAVIAYQVHEELIVEGEPVSMEAADCSTWIRRNGRWACAAHAQCIAGDPYGRDHQMPS